ncbi:hypothetical protein SAMN04490356_6527 [Streptomyces melanosporofaciens]|uniref:Uncharacterized protein n=1 Tax=Streptomyces melanosporofaciens TaxID=67327 RepID=A0A1H4X8E6_STRMJ|nr:hypothetical protein SAMN04490356_6527 [Streptomyces melanosporofaciens]
MAQEQAESRHPQIHMHRHKRAIAVKWLGEAQWSLLPALPEGASTSVHRRAMTAP